MTDISLYITNTDEDKPSRLKASLLLQRVSIENGGPFNQGSQQRKVTLPRATMAVPIKTVTVYAGSGSCVPDVCKEHAFELGRVRCHCANEPSIVF